MEVLNPLIGSEFPSQTAMYSGTAGNTGSWPAGPQGVLIWSTTPCYVLVGENVTATATLGTPIPAGIPIPFKIPITVSGLWRVSAIQISDSGVVYCKPINKA